MLKTATVDCGSRLPPPAALREQVLWVQIAVAEITGVALTELCGCRRGEPKTAFARQMAMYLCYLICAMSQNEVARAFGRDPSTIRHALHRVEEMREDREIDRTLQWLEAMLRQTGRQA